MLAIEEMLNDLIQNLDCLLIRIFFLQQFIEHPVNNLLQIVEFIREQFGNLVEIARKKQFVSEWLVEKLHINVADRIDLVQRRREYKDTRKIVSQVIDNPLVL